MSDQPSSPEAEEVGDRKAPGSHIVHQAIVAEGMEELGRTTLALAWSALAGGLSMGLSLITEATLTALLPDTAWRPLVAKLGYSVGFLVVILGRQQLFTENTIVPILPLLERKHDVGFGNVMRLWVTVFVGNLVGTLAVAVIIVRTNLLSEDIRAAIAELAKQAAEPRFGLVVLRGIFAGWLIALLVWLMPGAESARIWVIVIVTWIIGICRFSHVIAGSTEVFALASLGDMTWGAALGGFIAPALIGNVIGGVGVVACLNHAQATSGRR